MIEHSKINNKRQCFFCIHSYLLLFSLILYFHNFHKSLSVLLVGQCGCCLNVVQHSSRSQIQDCPSHSSNSPPWTEINVLLTDGSVHTLVADIDIQTTASLRSPLYSLSSATAALFQALWVRNYLTFPLTHLVAVTIILAYVSSYFFCWSSPRFYFSTKQRSAVVTHTSNLSLSIIITIAYPTFFQSRSWPHNLLQKPPCDIITKEWDRPNAPLCKKLNSGHPTTQENCSYSTISSFLLLFSLNGKRDTFAPVHHHNIHSSLLPSNLFRNFFRACAISSFLFLSSTLNDMEDLHNSLWYSSGWINTSRAFISRLEVLDNDYVIPNFNTLLSDTLLRTSSFVALFSKFSAHSALSKITFTSPTSIILWEVGPHL